MNLVNQLKTTDIERCERIVTPFGNSSLSLTGNSIVKFRIPREHFLLCQDFVLYFNAEADGDAASDDKFLNNISCIFDNYCVRVDGIEVQNVRQHGFLKCIDDNIRYSSRERTGWGAISQGIPALAASGSSPRYAVKLLHGNFFANVFPSYKLGMIEVEFQLNQNAAQYTKAATAVTEVDITNLGLHCPYIKSAQLNA